MEKTMSVEEKIRRAEEIYERRKQGNTKPVATVNIREKRDVKLLKKMIIQILICVTIYIIIYIIQNNNYVFSQEFLNKVNEILSYDTNFSQMYENIKNKAVNLITQNEENNQNAIGGAQEQIKVENENQEQSVEIVENQEQQSQVEVEKIQEYQQPLTQEEQDIQKIKNTTTFIKPVEGTISSGYGLREDATGNVPKNHTGTDIAANLGTKIKSATEGEVVLASEEGDYRKTLKNTNRRSKHYLCTLQ